MKNKLFFLGIVILLISFIILSAMLEKKNNNDGSNDNSNSSISTINRNSKIEDITFDDDKINIYFFWGNGCSHCEDQFEFLESIKDEYGNYYNIYTFEVWYNEDNLNLQEKVSTLMGKTVKGSVPYTIIGDEVISGFGASTEEKFKRIVAEQYNKKEKNDIFKSIEN